MLGGVTSLELAGIGRPTDRFSAETEKGRPLPGAGKTAAPLSQYTIGRGSSGGTNYVSIPPLMTPTLAPHLPPLLVLSLIGDGFFSRTEININGNGFFFVVFLIIVQPPRPFSSPNLHRRKCCYLCPHGQDRQHNAIFGPAPCHNNILFIHSCHYQARVP